MSKARLYIGVATACLCVIWAAAMIAEFLRSRQDLFLWLFSFASFFGVLYITYRVTLPLQKKRAESLFSSFPPEKAEVLSYLSTAITWLILGAALIGSVLFDLFKNGQPH